MKSIQVETILSLLLLTVLASSHKHTHTEARTYCASVIYIDLQKKAVCVCVRWGRLKWKTREAKNREKNGIKGSDMRIEQRIEDERTGEKWRYS